MVLDMARPKNKKSTIWLDMRGRVAARTSTLKVNILQVFTIDFSEIQFIVNHKVAIGWTEQKSKEWNELAQKDQTYKLEEKIQRTMVSYSEQCRQNGPMKLQSDYRAAVMMKNRLHHESGEPIEEPIHPDRFRRWHLSSSTSWWDKSEWNWKRA